MSFRYFLCRLVTQLINYRSFNLEKKFYFFHLHSYIRLFENPVPHFCFCFLSLVSFFLPFMPTSPQSVWLPTTTLFYPSLFTIFSLQHVFILGSFYPTIYLCLSIYLCLFPPLYHPLNAHLTSNTIPHFASCRNTIQPFNCKYGYSYSAAVNNRLHVSFLM